MKLVSRGDTTVADAYLSPLLRRYVERIARDLPGVPLMFMQSNGGLTSAQLFQGKDSVLSGPAGGVVGVARTALVAGFDRIIGFDMGGTSTDVSHCHGPFERTFDNVVAGVRLRAPMMAIHTVAAGGGSILHFDGARYRVGPDSAGANPGPACYRQGGPLTVTDANVLLGKIQPEFFPRVFGSTGDAPLDAEVARGKFNVLASEIRSATGESRPLEEIAEGFVRVAVDNMANAIKKISIERGHDVTAYTLCCFGGAAGQHACLVADALAIPRVFIHPYAGVLSAYGMGLADISAIREQAVEARLEAGAMPQLQAVLEKLADDARNEVVGQGVPQENIAVVLQAHLRYEGTDTTVVVGFGSLKEMLGEFEVGYRSRFSFLMPGRALVVEAVSAEATGSGAPVRESFADLPPRAGPALPERKVLLFSGSKPHNAPVYRRDTLRPGDLLTGPAIIAEANATTVIEPQWQAQVTPLNHLVLTRSVPRPKCEAIGTKVDPVMLEIFNNLFMAIAEQMGVMLANTAHSVNIKERLDFSCALFDTVGGLIANAPHLPVHLGAMGESVRVVATENAGKMRPGDAYMLNNPYHGGTHLPDITVITPVFEHRPTAGSDEGIAPGGSAGVNTASITGDNPDPRILFYVACRGHHADIGGITPGSMPPDSRHLDEEGVLIDNFKLVSGGKLLRAGNARPAGRYALPGAQPRPEPRRPDGHDRRQPEGRDRARPRGRALRARRGAGLHAPRAGQRRGIGAARDRCAEGWRIRLRDGQRSCHPRQDYRRSRRSQRATIDFTGTSGQLESNFNAPTAVTMSAVLYVFRTLVNDDIPAQRRLHETDQGRRPGRLHVATPATRQRWWRATSRLRNA